LPWLLFIKIMYNLSNKAIYTAYNFPDLRQLLDYIQKCKAKKMNR